MNDESLFHQQDVVNCGPITGATLQMLMITDDGFKIFNNLQQMGWVVPSESNASLCWKFIEEYLNLFNEYDEKIYVSVTK